MSQRKFYRTVIHVEILSDDPSPKDASLQDIAYQISEGDWSGATKMAEHEEMDGEKMAKLLQEQGSDPSFFQLTEDGKDEEGWEA